jgi:hypothetical protein
MAITIEIWPRREEGWEEEVQHCRQFISLAKESDA